MTNLKPFLVILVSVQVALPIPRFAVKNGTSCSTCHVSPTGAGLRNDYGITIVTMDELPLQKGMRFTDEDYSGSVGEHLRIGADFRLQVLSFARGDTARETPVFPMQGDVYGFLTASRAVHVYAKLDLVRGYPEFWTKLEVLPNDGYLKLGRRIPTYGLRLDDHTSLIRGGNLSLLHTKPSGEGFRKEGMPFSPRIQLPGMFEIGLKFSDFFFTGTISNPYIFGAETGFQSFQPFSEKNFAARLEYSGSVGNVNGLGGSSVMKEQDFLMWGIFGGVSLNNITWLGEVDVANGWVENGLSSLASYSELIVEPVQGINLIVKFDLFDEDTDLKENALSRYTAGLEIFPMSFLEVKTQARFTVIPDVDSQPAPEYLLQFHTWF